jgi:hypothetical protein
MNEINKRFKILEEHQRNTIRGSHSSGYVVSYLVGYNAMYSIESHLKFRRNISPPSSG